MLELIFCLIWVSFYANKTDLVYTTEATMKPISRKEHAVPSILFNLLGRPPVGLTRRSDHQRLIWSPFVDFWFFDNFSTSVENKNVSELIFFSIGFIFSRNFSPTIKVFQWFESGSRIWKKIVCWAENRSKKRVLTWFSKSNQLFYCLKHVL